MSTLLRWLNEYGAVPFFTTGDGACLVTHPLDNSVTILVTQRELLYAQFFTGALAVQCQENPCNNRSN